MSAEHTDDLEGLESAREDVTTAVMAMLEVAVIYPDARDTLFPALLRLGDAHYMLNAAIEAFGEPAEVTP